MSVARTPPPPNRIPTLTEVVDVQAQPKVVEEELISLRETLQPLMAESDVVSTREVTFPPRISEEQLAQRVLAELQWQIDMTFEQRLREAVDPVLARLTEALMHEMRAELVSTLRDVVARAVTQELSRQRRRP